MPSYYLQVILKPARSQVPMPLWLRLSPLRPVMKQSEGESLTAELLSLELGRHIPLHVLLP